MKKVVMMMMVVACTASGLFASPTSEFAEPPQLCTITIKGTYDGKSIDVNVTVEASNCAKAAGELLREAIRK